VADDLRAGRIQVVPAVDRLVADGVQFVDGTLATVDVVIAATGFRPGLERLVGHLGVLDEAGLPTAHDERAARPGLRFLNFGMRPGLLSAAGVRGRRTAAAIARDYRERDDDELGPGPVYRAQSMQVRAAGRASSRSAPIGRPQVSQRP
jgi:hypothetical protein